MDSLGHPIGFIHFGLASPSPSLSSVAAVHRLCIVPGPDENAAARELLDHAIRVLIARGCNKCLGIGAGEHSSFYLGIADGDNLMGVLATDHRSQRWLFEAGFAPIRPTESWDLELSTFRPPMDRLQIQARRTCTIGRMLDEEYAEWWMSAVLGHCEQTRFHLMTKNPATLGGVLSCWFPDAEVAKLDNSVVRISLSEPPDSEEQREQFVYLVAESLRQLQQERKRTVRAIASADKQRSITLLQRLGFRSVEHGLLFQRELIS